MIRNNFHNGDGDKNSRLKRYGISALTNTEFANIDQQFITACKNMNIEPTARQAGKFRNKKGLIYEGGK